MVFIEGVLAVAEFAFTVAIACGAIFFVLGAIYITPFCLWLVSQQCKGNYKHLSGNSFLQTVKDAAHLYKHFLFHTELTF